MNNLIVLPLLIPLCTAVVLVFFKNNVLVQRVISAVSVFINIIVGAVIVQQVHEQGIQTLHMGGWVPPYGIVFVADMFAALLVLTTAVVSAACLFYAFGTIGEQRERHYFYPFFQFLLAGVSGSFLTGDIFNLFVCFEVMLIASYALLVLGGTKRQIRETLKYILVNIVSSTLFVASVAYLYGVVGTLNMADLSLRIIETGQGGILSVIAILFLIVFALKAGLFLFFWLPGSYGAPPPAVAALFGALLTKVGLYAIIRTFTLIFPQQPFEIQSWIGWLAAGTMILGAIGAVAYQDIRRILNYNVIISVGFIAFGVAVGNGDAMDGAVYYLVHDMLAKALMFFLGGMIITAAGTDKLSEMGGLIKRHPLTGWMFLILAFALVGIPPLSGFPGKLLMVRGGLAEGEYWLTAIGVASSFIVLYSLIRVFMKAFWGEEKPPAPNSGNVSHPKMSWKLAFIPSAFLLLLVFMLGFASEGVYAYVSQAGEVLVQPALYIEAVLKE
ncbi:Na+/H+ antiporter subunit D [Paenibacillus sp. P96]|uniref:Na+/H+ antiporter subunit D n=1 Tax=Paenibacillus zeirhizosphaerae TaxID=2987519 RepID=A0ABT9FRI0_9BACL|nr:Na+/H+ antiporter subunit D [Paenibacillus sp. P96]MDP4097220.1 Na+/H+ antiporter subunit D [Paenibacillus sp. P96]